MGCSLPPRPELPYMSLPRRRPERNARACPAQCAKWPPVGADDLPADMLLPRLIGVKRSQPGCWTACCPAHPDSTPSLSITEADDYRLLVYCHAGCDTTDVLAAVGLRMRDV